MKVNISFKVVFSLWALAPIGQGLDLESEEFGSVMAVVGGLTFLYQILIYPVLAQKSTPILLFQSTLPLYLLVFMAFPLLTALMTFPSLIPYIWYSLFPVLALRRLANVICFTSCNLMISNSARQGQLGVINGLAAMCASFLRGIGPIFAGGLWSLSLALKQPFPLDQSLVFSFLFLLTLAMISQSMKLAPLLMPGVRISTFNSLP